MTEPYKIHKVFAQSSTSLAIVIPTKYAKELDLVDGSHVFITVQNGRLVIEKVKAPNTPTKEAN